MWDSEIPPPSVQSPPANQRLIEITSAFNGGFNVKLTNNQGIGGGTSGGLILHGGTDVVVAIQLVRRRALPQGNRLRVPDGYAQGASVPESIHHSALSAFASDSQITGRADARFCPPTRTGLLSRCEAGWPGYPAWAEHHRKGANAKSREPSQPSVYPWRFCGHNSDTCVVPIVK